ncbi:alpha-2-macroglobulin [Marinicauda salina]|uniref:Alpha-2-macroglobulin n=1 Tax=Marinicauda salina TaxID=2135793 RepID=A0A2U2BVV6_9PROT|nr:alpha-2-macroglobulin [Marinicauda salina]PWE18132.1 alpha-2-macroglobulin [Marinicauda salina]
MGRLTGFLTAALAALLVASCGDRGEEPREREAAEREAETSRETEPEQFEYLRYATDLDQAAPELCLVFSGALDPEIDYSAYLDIGEPVALAVDGSRLCIGGLTFGQTRTVTLRRGLPAADGQALSAEESVTLSFAERPAYVGFAGDGVILPRIDADGVAIETVNVEAVEVVVERVTDRALAFREIVSGYSAAEDEYNYTPQNERPDELGVEVWRGRMDTEGPENAATTTVFPIAEAVGELEPGAYYVSIEDVDGVEDDDGRPGARAARWLVVTDLAFTAYRGRDGLDVVVRSLQTAEPERGVEVQLVARSNEILAEADTGREGRVRFDGPLIRGEDGNRPRLLAAYGPDGDFAVLDLTRAPVDLSEHPVSGRGRTGAADAYLYFDRGIYRPGETVRASGLLRDPEGFALTDRPGTLVLTAPNGLEHASQRFEAAPEAGAVIHAFELPDAAARGRWTIAVELDGIGTVARESFAVEDFVPQRVELTLAADDETPMRAGQTRMIEARARFLYGAPGAGLPISGTARVQVDPSPFENLRDYRFGLHDEQFSEQAFALPEIAADGAGEASLPVEPGRRGVDSTQPLRVRAVVEVQEPGGRAVRDDVRIPYRPRETYYGLRSEFGDDRPRRREATAFSLIAVDRTGAMEAGRADWRLVRHDWDYDWYRTDGGEWRWRRTHHVVEIEEGRVALDGESPARIETPELDWGDYELIVSVDGEDVASDGFWVGWGSRAEDGVEAPDRVRVAGPDAPVGVGERAEVSILAPYAGLAEVVVATDRVLETRHVRVPEGGTSVEFTATEDWGAGAYVMVSVYTPRDAVTQPRPRRAVGVTHLPVDVSERTFEVAVEAPEVIEPNQTYDFTIEATDGPRREATWVTLAAVDEGILLLTGFDSPNPVERFFGKARLGVDLLDDYGRLLDPNQGAAAPIRSGGDQIGGAGLTVVPTQTVALFSGPVRLDGNGRAEVSLDIPDFNGELRLMAVAWSESGVGAGARPVTVRDPVPAELVLPRFLAPGDEAQATATLDNVAGPGGDYAASMSATGPVEILDDAFSIDLPQGERRDVPVDLRARDEGIAEIVIDVDGPGDFAVGSSYPIQVRSPYLPTSSIERVVLDAGESYTPAGDMLDAYVPGSASLQVSASVTPIDVSALYESLSRYPYACTEQLVSRALPLVYAGRLAALTDADGPADAGLEIQEAIETLLSRQSNDGAFGLWRIGDRNASPWLGAYAADFLSRAAEAGHPVPPAALDRALSALRPVARGELYRVTGYETDSFRYRWSKDTRDRLVHRSSAYANYVLARNGRADRSRLRYMHDEMLRDIESPLARAQIGAGLAAIGDRSRAVSAFEAAVDALGYENEGDYYQSPRRDLAGVLALAAEAGLSDRVAGLVARVQQELPEPRRLTTQEKAFLIVAAGAVAGDRDEVSIRYDGDAPDPTAVTFDRASLAEAGTFTNSGEQPVWVTALARGAPASAPPPASSGLTVTKTIRDTAGRPANLSALSRGDRLIVSISVRADEQRVTPLVVADLLPAGFEIEAVVQRAETTQTGVYSWHNDLSTPSIAEARDDRFVAAIDIRDDDAVELAYLVRAVTPGRFAMPGVVAEDMYRPEVFGRSAPGEVVISP